MLGRPASGDRVAPTREDRHEPVGCRGRDGLIEGNPIVDAIVQRRPDALPEIKRALAANIAAALGDHPVRIPLRAIVFSARRP